MMTSIGFALTALFISMVALYLALNDSQWAGELAILALVLAVASNILVQVS